jgi:hypothetical protein
LYETLDNRVFSNHVAASWLATYVQAAAAPKMPDAVSCHWLVAELCVEVIMDAKMPDSAVLV